MINKNSDKACNRKPKHGPSFSACYSTYNLYPDAEQRNAKQQREQFHYNDVSFLLLMI